MPCGAGRLRFANTVIKPECTELGVCDREQMPCAAAARPCSRPRPHLAPSLGPSGLSYLSPSLGCVLERSLTWLCTRAQNQAREKDYLTWPWNRSPSLCITLHSWPSFSSVPPRPSESLKASKLHSGIARGAASFSTQMLVRTPHACLPRAVLVVRVRSHAVRSHFVRTTNARALRANATKLRLPTSRSRAHIGLHARPPHARSHKRTYVCKRMLARTFSPRRRTCKACAHGHILTEQT